jgi:hypothetical protein
MFAVLQQWKRHFRLHSTGVDLGLHVLADGFLRVEAARREKRTHIKAIIQTGTLADAIELAITRNAHNPLPLTTSQRERAALRMLALHQGR